MRLTREEGEGFVRMARRAIEAHVRDGRRIEPRLDSLDPPRQPEQIAKPRPRGRRRQLVHTGVFVSLYKEAQSERQLRGCIGSVTIDRPFAEALVDAAINTASADPRFAPLSKDELDHVTVEVSILSEPQRLSARSPLEYPALVRPGRDGLLIKLPLGSGLLLPQVATEYSWTSEDFLSHACMKAGGTPDLWLTREAGVYTFQAEVFAETTPRGTVTKRASA